MILRFLGCLSVVLAVGGRVLRLCPTSDCGGGGFNALGQGLGLRSHLTDDAEGLFGTRSFEMFAISGRLLLNMFS